MNRKILSILLALVIAPPVLADNHIGTLKRIADTGIFRIGYRTDARPLSFVDEQGEPAGYSVDLCRRIGAAVKDHLARNDLEIKFVAVTSENRITAVEKGDIDIECGSTTVTLGRQEKVDFTLMTFVTGGSVLSLSDSGIRALSDLAGRKVAAIEDTTSSDSLRAFLDDNLIDAQIVSVTNRREAMEKLNSGEVDGFASDQIVLIGQALESKNPQKYTLTEDLFSFEPYSLMVKRNDADFRLVANRALAQIFRAGQYVSLYNKWIGKVGIRPSPMLMAMYKVQTLPE